MEALPTDNAADTDTGNVVRNTFDALPMLEDRFKTQVGDFLCDQDLLEDFLVGIIKLRLVVDE